MNIIKKSLKLKGSDYYSKHFEIVNVFLRDPLKKSEINVISNLLDISEKRNKDFLDEGVKKEVREKLNITELYMSQFISKFRVKGLIGKTKKQILDIGNISQGYQIKLIKE